MKTLLNLVSLKVVSFFVLSYTGLVYLKLDIINESAVKFLATFPWTLMLLTLTTVFAFYIRFVILEMKEQETNNAHSSELA